MQCIFLKLLLFKDKFVPYCIPYDIFTTCSIPVLLAYLTYSIKKEDAPWNGMHACRHCTVNCQEDVREVLCVRGRFVARRAWPCVGVMSMRLEGKGGGEERAGKMDKKLPGSSELSWVRTFGRGQEGGGQRRRETRKGEGGGERRWMKNYREV